MSKEGSNASRGFKKCVECGSTKLTKYANEIITCADCGFVAVDATDADTTTADHNPHRNPYNPRPRKNYINAYMKKLTPHISGRTKPGSQYYIDLDKMPRNDFVEMWWKNAKVSNGTEKNLALAFSEITKIGDILSLPKSVLEKAATTYKMIAEKHYVKGRNIRALSAATAYMACKQCGFPRTLKEIVMASKISKRKVWRGYSFLVKELGCFIPPVKADQYLKKLLNQTAISEKTKQITNKILGVANELKLTSGRDPMGVVAASYYIASLLIGERKTQREIAEITRVTEATIRNRYKEFVERLLFTLVI